SVRSRLGFLDRVGVGYVALDRPSKTLSGGESQRVRLAGCVGAALRGVCYVLDEPTLGLHARDGDRLIEVLENLRDSGSAVLMVEHDGDALLHADWFVDVGPFAGANGGRLIHSGTKKEFFKSKGLTAEFLSGRRSAATSEISTEPPDQWLDL